RSKIGPPDRLAEGDHLGRGAQEVGRGVHHDRGRHQAGFQALEGRAEGLVDALLHGRFLAAWAAIGVQVGTVVIRTCLPGSTPDWDTALEIKSATLTRAARTSRPGIMAWAAMIPGLC